MAYVASGYVADGYVQPESARGYVAPGYVAAGYVQTNETRPYVAPGYVLDGYVSAGTTLELGAVAYAAQWGPAALVLGYAADPLAFSAINDSGLLSEELDGMPVAGAAQLMSGLLSCGAVGGAQDFSAATERPVFEVLLKVRVLDYLAAFEDGEVRVGLSTGPTDLGGAALLGAEIEAGISPGAVAFDMHAIAAALGIEGITETAVFDGASALDPMLTVGVTTEGIEYVLVLGTWVFSGYFVEAVRRLPQMFLLKKSIN